MSAREFLLDQWARHPASRLQDLRKALYQSTFGCGHLVDDPSAAADWIRREAEHAPDCREMEPLDGPWCRVPLGILSEGLTPETLAAAFAQSAAVPGEDIPALEDRLAVLMGLIRRRERFPLTLRRLQRRLPPGGRWLFRPATIPRITGTPITRPTGCCIRRYAHLLPLLAAIDRALGSKPRMLLAIEGGSASGKSTLAELLTGIYPDAALFHADDYFLRPEQRTPERFAQPGGNMDRERLEAEILAPLSRGGDVVYRPFDCETMSLSEPRRSRAARLNIVEGAYSLHPSLETVLRPVGFPGRSSPESQRRRVLERNGPEWGQMLL